MFMDVIAYVKSDALTDFTWCLAPTLTISDWESHLLPHGFRYDYNAHGMAVDLRKLNFAQETLPGLAIMPVSDIPTLQEWTHTFMLGYELPPAWESSLLALMTGIGLEWPVRNYLGYLNGKPVATSNVFLGAGVAGVQFVATLPEARGQGIGAALTLAPLRETQPRGYRIGILQSSNMGYQVYQRLGFQRVCQMEHFYWSSESAAV